MTISAHIDNSRQVTIFTAVGAITFSDVMAALESYYNDAPTPNIIWDFRDARPGEVILPRKLKEIASFAQQRPRMRTGGKTAFVASQDLVFGILKMYEGFAARAELAHSVKTFRSMEEALTWL